ncbi:hypothetical protein Aeh1gORF298c [Aeromonas phage Aeh1]|uniref:Uncharacterized protein n=1 Tax=Aeromonas phage Aeh1 TaxID=2880362 RepID=Q76YH8_9CAUD|nr:hypothetical protein Aeh1p267 [Aeromonas phage Aeh1]AAQ17917.1 hypothetical protein Aeh1gORF298c [Aeromonas phage Aeh1]
MPPTLKSHYRVNGNWVSGFEYQSYQQGKHECGETALYTNDYIIVTYFTLQSTMVVTYDRLGNPVSNSTTGQDARMLKSRYDLVA